MTATTITTGLNGVDIDAVRGARQALTDAPAAAAFQWRADCAWVSGTHCATTVHDFFGLGQEQTHRQSFTFHGDHPEVFASEDHGATPVETLLVALAGCLTAGVATVAANRGVSLRSVQARLEGDMDLRGILGIDPEVRNGFQQIRVRYEVDADATAEEISSIVAQATKRSAVFDLLTTGTDVQVDLV